MNIQSSIFTSAFQQPAYSVTAQASASSQTENESVTTRPVERVTQIEPGEESVLGGQLDIFV